MIHNITDRERSLESLVAQLSQGRDALAQRVEALEVQNARLRAELATLKMVHIYAGSCPDALDPDTRDPKCSACRAMMKLEKTP